jgi:hypothetical protein
MSQLLMFEGSAPSDLPLETVPKSKIKSKSRPIQSKQSNSSVSIPTQVQPSAVRVLVEAQLKEEIQEKPAPYGLCSVCNSPIATPGLDALLCSNPNRTCGSGGWVINSQWLAANPRRNSKGGAA